MGVMNCCLERGNKQDIIYANGKKGDPKSQTETFNNIRMKKIDDPDLQMALMGKCLDKFTPLCYKVMDDYQLKQRLITELNEIPGGVGDLEDAFN